ncbi:SA1362 family protein [Staphylococcus sp. NAM3COL9]|uniref:SA1362 family protein n=1 Tax=Staphylococcus sp. NAM3COL9 TaxID=1667172 RepID=UPI000709628B|nr:SA1362 family protein [Staphylococcus sp. NAM3COL9]KRG10257.1 membrane protein [Staphylococcus sp. NAM3COL9]
MKRALFYIIIAIAAIGLILNLDAFIFSFVSMAISFAVFAGIIYAIYYFFFLTEDQRKYKRAQRKYKRRNRKK